MLLIDKAGKMIHNAFLSKTGAICNSVCPHSSERFLQCAINEGRGTMYCKADV